MNYGGEPGHDDDGLPRVDIKVPDDARELYRDVQAYHRELRAQRRLDRSIRLRAPLRRSASSARGGVPLIAACLVLTMIAGMALTLFTASSYFSGRAMPDRVSPKTTGRDRGSGNKRPSPHLSQAGAPSAGAPATGGIRAGTPATRTPAAGTPPLTAPGLATRGALGGVERIRLPGGTIMVAGQPVALRTLTSAALLMVPSRCACASAVRRLLSQARPAGIAVYLIGRRGARQQVTALARAAKARSAVVATDTGNALYSTYKPAGLALLLVDSGGTVGLVRHLSSHFDVQARLASLRPAR